MEPIDPMLAFELMTLPVAVADPSTLQLRYGNAAFARWHGGTLPSSLGDLVADFDANEFTARLQRRGLLELTGTATGPGARAIEVRYRVHPVALPDGPALLIEGIDQSKVAATRALFEDYVKLLESRNRSLERKLSQLALEPHA